MHRFADAPQEHGFGTASYLRLVNDEGETHCSFLMGKASVRPLKGTGSVPRLELTAATLATKIGRLLVQE